MRVRLAFLASLLWVVAACGDDEGTSTDASAIDAATDAEVDAAPFVEPTMLSETGLYSDIAAGTIAAGNVEFEPRWKLWSDAAEKRRWIYLPPGAKIDTSDMDFWKFPQGTKVWKEFTRGGVRVETRFMQKIGPTDDVADWFMVSFQWNQGQTDATAVPAGVVDDAGHNDIPSRSDCRKCHGPNRNPSVVLGFQAFQLDYAPTNSGFPTLATLISQNRLTVAPTGSGVPYFPIGSSGAADLVSEAAIGYLHGNCGGCHNQHSDVVMTTTELELRLTVDPLKRTSWAVTVPYTHMVNANSTITQGAKIVVPHDPGAGVLYQRITTNGVTRMPPVGRETVDNGAVADVSAWIDALP